MWERSREEAVALHTAYFQELCASEDGITLQDVYIDITGNKHIYKRQEMVRLLRSCLSGEVDVIRTPTRAYIAPNSEEFCYLIKYLFDLSQRIDIITDDNDRRIDTLLNVENQRECLYRMAESFVNLDISEYGEWVRNLENAMART